MLNKPYIHYIDVKIMNNVRRITTGLFYNDMFIKDVGMNIANERLLLL